MTTYQRANVSAGPLMVAALSLVHAIAGFVADAGQGAAIIAEPARSPEPLLAAARPNDGGARQASWV